MEQCLLLISNLFVWFATLLKKIAYFTSKGASAHILTEKLGNGLMLGAKMSAETITDIELSAEDVELLLNDEELCEEFLESLF